MRLIQFMCNCVSIIKNRVVDIFRYDTSIVYNLPLTCVLKSKQLFLRVSIVLICSTYNTKWIFDKCRIEAIQHCNIIKIKIQF